MGEYWPMEPSGFLTERAEDQYSPRWSLAEAGNERFSIKYLKYTFMIEKELQKLYSVLPLEIIRLVTDIF